MTLPETPSEDVRAADPLDPPSAVGEDLAALRLPEPDGLGSERRGRRRWLFAAGVAVGVALLGWGLLMPRPLPVETVRATPIEEVSQEPIPVLSGSGYLVPAQPTTAIGSRVSGRIARYLVEEGDRVLEGQPLVELEARPFQATVDQVRASLASARARLVLAESELARTRALLAEGVQSREELDRRESEARVARATVRELEASLARAAIDLEDTVIRAPTPGVVLETFKQPGEVAVPGGFSGSGDLLRLANLSELRAELDVNEADLPRVSLSQPARVVPDAFPEASYAAVVVKLAPQIDRQKGTREVEVRVLEPDERLLPDMSVRVVFLAEIGREAPPGAAPPSAVVPRSALRRDDGGRAFVWVVRAGRAERVQVEVAEALGDRVLLRSGLVGGERVVVGPGPTREGQRLDVGREDDGAPRPGSGEATR